MSRLSDGERTAKWGFIREQFGSTFCGATLQALCADHEALAAINARLTSDCAELKRIYASALGRAEKAEAENAALKAVPGDVAEAVSAFRLLLRVMESDLTPALVNDTEAADLATHLDTILAALNTQDEEIAALRGDLSVDDVMSHLVHCQDECETGVDRPDACTYCAVHVAGYYPDCPMALDDTARTATYPQPEETE